MNMDATKVKHDALDAMWTFLQMNGQRGDVTCLRENCEMLQRLMMQKTAGQRRDKSKDIPFYEIDGVINAIVIEAMCLYLDGTLAKMESEE